MYKDLGGEIITTGSDSHNPAQIAYNFDYIYSYLQSIGLFFHPLMNIFKHKGVIY